MKNFEFLTQAEIEKVHSISLQNLWKTGILVNDEKILGTLDEAGCIIDKSTKIVKFPESLVEDCIKSTPSSFNMGARSQKHIIRVGEGVTHTRPMSGCFMILDLETGECREGLESDVAKCSLLVNELDNITYNGAIIYPSNEPPMIRDIHLLKVMLSNSLKSTMS